MHLGRVERIQGISPLHPYQRLLLLSRKDGLLVMVGYVTPEVVALIA